MHQAMEQALQLIRENRPESTDRALRASSEGLP
jgi:hypothetical protein